MTLCVWVCVCMPVYSMFPCMCSHASASMAALPAAWAVGHDCVCALTERDHVDEECQQGRTNKTRAHASTHTHAHACVHTQICTRPRPRVHTCIHTHMNMCTHVRACVQRSPAMRYAKSLTAAHRPRCWLCCYSYGCQPDVQKACAVVQLLLD